MPRTHTFPIICNWTDGTWTQENYDFPEIPDGKEPSRHQVIAKIQNRLTNTSPYQLSDFILTPAIDDLFNEEDTTYPHGDKYPMAPTVPGLYLRMWNGNRDYVPGDYVDDWGFDGPHIGPLKYVQVTYGVTVRFEPADGCDITHFLPEPDKTDEQGLSINSLGYLCHDECCYGDWSIYYHAGEPECPT